MSSRGRCCSVSSVHVRSKCVSTFYSVHTEGSWGRHLRWRCIGKATGLALPITHRRGRPTPTQPAAPHTAWALSSKISGMISVKLGVYLWFSVSLQPHDAQRPGWASVFRPDQTIGNFALNQRLFNYIKHTKNEFQNKIPAPSPVCLKLF